MSHIVQFAGERDPSLFATLSLDGVARDLSGATVKLRIRPFGTDDLKLDTPATVVSAATTLDGAHVLPDDALEVASTAGFLPSGALDVGGQVVEYQEISGNVFLDCSGGQGAIPDGAAVAQRGGVRYDWTADDIAPPNGVKSVPGFFSAWWLTTVGGKDSSVPPILLEFQAHAPIANAYLELEEFKKTLELAGFSYADMDIRTAIAAACRAVDEICDRRFYVDPDANQIRYFTPRRPSSVDIDDLIELTSMQVDTDGDGDVDETWVVGTDFVLEPRNAPLDNKPWERIRLLHASSRLLPQYANSMKVTGRFGWAAVPAVVKSATSIIAAQVLRRMRELPFGAAGAGFSAEAAVEIARSDPDVQRLLKPVMRETLVA
jgi:hypothetical protein